MNNKILLSTRKGLFVFEETQNGWALAKNHFLGENVTYALVDVRTGHWFVSLNLGHFGVKLKRTSDQGSNWEECALPAYPDDAVVSTGDGKPPQQANLNLLWTLAAGGDDQPARIWAGTIPGGLFRSDDLGNSWRLCRSLWDSPERPHWFGGGYDAPGIHSICVDPRNSKTIRIAISCGGVWMTRNDGDSWTQIGTGLFAEYMPPDRRSDLSIQDPHCMVQCVHEPDRLWIQHHNGIFYSHNGGIEWHYASGAVPSGFGFAVAVNPQNGHQAWFVPAVKDECRVPVNGRLVVTMTKDSAKSFEICDRGLPEIPSFDLCFRHALAINRAGDRLAFGTTTGGAWVCTTDTLVWHQLPVRLPPIHAVCFA